MARILFMIFETTEEIIAFVKEHQQVSDNFKTAREQHRELLALVEGDDFKKELIKRIEKIESLDKAESRKKHSRNIVDFYERLLNPISNVFSATGGSKKYELEGDQLTELLKKIANIRGGKSIEKFVQEKWIPLYHIDPNGIIFMEFFIKENEERIKPTYKSINTIRAYRHKGQLLEALLFEPKPLGVSGDLLWRLVDDIKEYAVVQRGDVFSVNEELTFEHPFGEVPGIIISDIVKINKDVRLSPIHRIVELSKEYARDQSIKTIYKFLHGFPIFWKYIATCKTCHGTGKTGDKSCTGCEGKGFYQKKDVTDVVTLPIPDKEDVKLAPDIAGFISPDLKTWDQYTLELELLERIAEQTHWGTFKEKKDNETATGRFIDTQPVINKLTMYSSSAEFIEWKITEWCANFLFPAKDKKESIAFISYGRRYIIEPPDVILDRYEKAKEQGDNTTILDRLLNEYVTAKYRSDPAWLRKELSKLEIEPYIHLTIEQVFEIFGREEAQRKGLFEKWWNTLSKEDLSKDSKTLTEEFKKWFNENKIEIDNADSSNGLLPVVQNERQVQ